MEQLAPSVNYEMTFLSYRFGFFTTVLSAFQVGGFKVQQENHNQMTKSLCMMNHLVPCKIISDLKLYKNHPSPINMTRCRVQFAELTSSQISWVQHFIQNYTTS